MLTQPVSAEVSD